jgi:hypothetical protein
VETEAYTLYEVSRNPLLWAAVSFRTTRLTCCATHSENRPSALRGREESLYVLPQDNPWVLKRYSLLKYAFAPTKEGHHPVK